MILQIPPKVNPSEAGPMETKKYPMRLELIPAQQAALDARVHAMELGAHSSVRAHSYKLWRFQCQCHLPSQICFEFHPNSIEMRVCIVLVKKLEQVNHDSDVQIDQENTVKTVTSLTISDCWFRASISKTWIKRDWSW